MQGINFLESPFAALDAHLRFLVKGFAVRVDFERGLSAGFGLGFAGFPGDAFSELLAGSEIFAKNVNRLLGDVSVLSRSVFAQVVVRVGGKSFTCRAGTAFSFPLLACYWQASMEKGRLPAWSDFFLGLFAIGFFLRERRWALSFRRACGFSGSCPGRRRIPATCRSFPSARPCGR